MNRTSQESNTTALDEAIQTFLRDLHDARFFGIVELHYQDGNVVRVKKQEVFQPKDLLK
jgi:flavin-binding protein dodecin